MRDGNEIPTAIAYAYVSMLRQHNWIDLNTACVGVSEQSKMAVCNWKWLWNNVYLSLYMIASKF